MGNGVSVARGCDYSMHSHSIRPQTFGNPAEGLENMAGLKSTTYREAQQQLSERVEKLIKSGEYPGGKLKVRGDLGSLTEMAFSGGEQALLVIEQRGGSYEVVDLPVLDYTGN